MKYTKITISGKVCTGKTTLFKDLHKTLGWPTISTGQYFREYTTTHNLSLENAEEQNEKVTKEVDERIKNTIINAEHIIADGWMTGITTKNQSNILHVLLTADDEKRFERFASREHTSIEEARTRVLQRENAWMEKLSAIYKRNDFFDPSHYNVVIDTTNLTREQTLEKVISMID